MRDNRPKAWKRMTVHMATIGGGGGGAETALTHYMYRNLSICLSIFSSNFKCAFLKEHKLSEAPGHNHG